MSVTTAVLPKATPAVAPRWLLKESRVVVARLPAPAPGVCGVRSSSCQCGRPAWCCCVADRTLLPFQELI